MTPSAARKHGNWRKFVPVYLVVVMGVALLSPVGTLEYPRCRVCGKTEGVRYRVLGRVVSQAGVDDPDSFATWFDAHIHVPHEHDWSVGCIRTAIPVALVLWSLVNPKFDPVKTRLGEAFGFSCYMDKWPFETFDNALMLIPEPIAVHLATRMAQASSQERTQLMRDLEWHPVYGATWEKAHPCDTTTRAFWAPVEALVLEGAPKIDPVKVNQTYQAWLQCYPEWR